MCKEKQLKIYIPTDGIFYSFDESSWNKDPDV